MEIISAPLLGSPSCMLGCHNNLPVACLTCLRDFYGYCYQLSDLVVAESCYSMRKEKFCCRDVFLCILASLPWSVPKVLVHATTHSCWTLMVPDNRTSF
jgi:hypothetical protein